MDKALEPYFLPGTEKTPEVRLDPVAGRLDIRGCSIPENADAVFSPLFNLLATYGHAPAKETVVQVMLTYFNSSSSKYLLDLLKQLEDLHAEGRSKVRMVWQHDADDLDMQEAGHDYQSLLEFPVEVVPN